MKRLIVIACVGLFGALGIAVAAKLGPFPAGAEKSGSTPPPIGKLIVHEWGTFTGFAGSDGVHLPFNTTVGSDLPPFVVNRQQQALRQDPKLQLPAMFIKGGGIAALQRMETPVVYLYADAPGDVKVRVDFPRGTLTEFFPPVRSMGPNYGAGFGEPGAAGPSPASPTYARATPPASFLDWSSVGIIPHPTGAQSKLIPAVAEGSRYSFARRTDSALVQIADADGTRHYEKFLFYRGLGNFTLPVTLLAHGADGFELKNAGPSPITSAFLIQISGDTQKSIRFGRFENVMGNQQLTLPPRGGTCDELADAIAKSLVAEGLFEKEAVAMVETWKSTWLIEPGTRLLYIVPRPVTDTLLPLSILPTPAQTVRVLVGRIDILTPERETRLRDVVATANPAKNLSDDDGRMLIGLNRFLAPAVEQAAKLAGDVNRVQINRLYEELARWQANHK